MNDRHGVAAKDVQRHKNIFYFTHAVAAAVAFPPDNESNAALAWSGYCLYKYSMINAIGFAGFSISRDSTIEINKLLMFLEFKYC